VCQTNGTHWCARIRQAVGECLSSNRLFSRPFSTHHLHETRGGRSASYCYCSALCSIGCSKFYVGSSGESLPASFEVPGATGPGGNAMPKRAGRGRNAYETAQNRPGQGAPGGQTIPPGRSSTSHPSFAPPFPNLAGVWIRICLPCDELFWSQLNLWTAWNRPEGAATSRPGNPVPPGIVLLERRKPPATIPPMSPLAGASSLSRGLTRHGKLLRGYMYGPDYHRGDSYAYL